MTKLERLQAGIPCKHCGSEKCPDTSCSHCGGHGLVHGYEGDPRDCPSCGGSGIQWPAVCPDCSKWRSMEGWL